VPALALFEDKEWRAVAVDLQLGSDDRAPAGRARDVLRWLEDRSGV
jgi:hypothetical protein